MPSWPPGTAATAKAWEQRGCVLHYDRGWNGHGEGWDCWAHDACPAIDEHRQLREAPRPKA